MTDPTRPQSHPLSARPRIDRREASRYLMEAHGLKVAPATLAGYASSGGGPLYAKAGATPLYAPADLDAWAQARLTPVAATASELKRSRPR